ncbi:unnamed protein product, partial [Protopolystoma xenopodis]
METDEKRELAEEVGTMEPLPGQSIFCPETAGGDDLLDSLQGCLQRPIGLDLKEHLLLMDASEPEPQATDSRADESIEAWPTAAQADLKPVEVGQVESAKEETSTSPVIDVQEFIITESNLVPDAAVDMDSPEEEEANGNGDGDGEEEVELGRIATKRDSSHRPSNLSSLTDDQTPTSQEASTVVTESPRSVKLMSEAISEMSDCHDDENFSRETVRQDETEERFLLPRAAKETEEEA